VSRPLAPEQADRGGPPVVVVHGLAHPSLEAVLRAAGLISVHQADTVTIWAPPPNEPVSDNVVAADPGSGKLLLTITEAAERLSVGRSTIYELINHGDLPVTHIGRSARISVTALEDFARARRQVCRERAAGERLGHRIGAGLPKLA
jgi:excisionase family DNA binding protein